MKATVVVDRTGGIVAIATQPTVKEEDVELLPVEGDPDAGHVVYEIDLPEGVDLPEDMQEGRLPDLLRDLRVETTTPRLRRVQVDKS